MADLGNLVDMEKILIIAALLLTISSCSTQQQGTNNTANNSSGASPTSPTPIPTASVPKNGDYQGKGKVTKINNELGSVEIEHEEIKDVMPAMPMELYVSNKAMLKTIKVGDQVDFTLRYKDGQETIISISKAR